MIIRLHPFMCIEMGKKDNRKSCRSVKRQLSFWERNEEMYDKIRETGDFSAGRFH